jgi:hypothetical protein
MLKIELYFQNENEENCEITVNNVFCNSFSHGLLDRKRQSLL